MAKSSPGTTDSRAARRPLRDASIGLGARRREPRPIVSISVHLESSLDATRGEGLPRPIGRDASRRAPQEPARSRGPSPNGGSLGTAPEEESLEEHGDLGHEVKFVLPSAAVAAARLLLRAATRPDPAFPGGQVDSLYFENERGSALAAKLDSDYLKSKLRLRWYDGREPVFLEQKLRVGSRRRKVRHPLAELGGRIVTHGFDALHGGELTGEIARFAGGVAAAQFPVLHLRYRRERFLAPGGSRLSLDHTIELLASRSYRKGVARRLPFAIVEVKGGDRDLPPGCGALVALGLRRCSMSKFATGLALLEQQ
jgi:hypothetical protein